MLAEALDGKDGLRRDGVVRIAYILSRFPKLTETFVLNEILAVERNGLGVQVYSLLTVRDQVIHKDAARLVDETLYAPFLSRDVVGAQFAFMRRNPRTYVKVLIDVVRGLARSPRMLFKTAIFLPKAVYYARVMQQSAIGHIHAHFATHATTAAWVAHRLTGIPYTFTAHAHDLYVDLCLLREKVRDAEFVVTISEFNKDLIIKQCGEDISGKVHVIRCGADLELFRPVERASMDTTLDIVCVGALEEKKGQTHLIEACRLLKQTGVPFACRLVGDGPRRAMLEQEARDAGVEVEVTFTGGIPRETVADVVRHADVVVLPSVRAESGMMEGIPVALMEAMACEVPVVSTRLSGIPELVEDGVNGLLVEPGDAAGLAECLRRLYRSPALRRSLGRAGREKVLQDFDLRANASTLAGFFLRQTRQASEIAEAATAPKTVLERSLANPV